MDIVREELARSAKKEELLSVIQEKAQELQLTEQGHTDHGPVYVSLQYDLRIEKDPGFGQYKVMLMYKLQPPPSLADRLRKRIRGG